MRRSTALSVFIVMLLLLTTLPTSHAQDGARPATYKLDIERLRHEYQGWNNCGPTTLTMGLSYFGYSEDQFPAADYLKPHREDKNVSPSEMAQYVNEEVEGIRALYRVGGTQELIKTLLAADFPVIIEKGFEPEGYDWMGHYLLLIGYDDPGSFFYTYDSFEGHGSFQGLHEEYDSVDHYWWHFSNTFIVLYAPEREDGAMALLGDLADPNYAYQVIAQEGLQRVSLEQTDAWSWFNIGDALTMLGRYEDATAYFRTAFDNRLPWRTLWYRHTPLEAFYQTGQFETLLGLIHSNKVNTPYVEEWYYYEGLVYASRGNFDAARAQFNQALVYNSHYQVAIDALATLDNGTFQAVAEATTTE